MHGPFNHAEDLQRVVDSLVPTLCRLSGKNDPREFMALFDHVMDIWDEDVPHTDKQGHILPAGERRMVGTSLIANDSPIHMSR